MNVSERKMQCECHKEDTKRKSLKKRADEEYIETENWNDNSKLDNGIKSWMRPSECNGKLLNGWI